MARAIVNVANGGIGDVRSAMLTEVQFQAQNGPGWILADGRSVVGTAYGTLTGNTTAPDARGIALRGKNNGRVDGNQDPSGERALGNFQTHGVESHGHQLLSSIAAGGGTSHLVAGPCTSIEGTNNTLQGYTNLAPANGNPFVQVTGTNETRMKNVAVNYFIRVN